jgi:chemotaxis signal transduction protein
VSSSTLGTDRVRELRENFDQSFAGATEVEHVVQLDFLAIRVAGDPYALRLSEVASLHSDRRLVSAPSLLPELLGLTGFRGVLTPVYDLGTALGYRAGSLAKWLVIARWASPIAFAFETFDAHLRTPIDHVSSANAPVAGSANGAVQSGSTTLPLLHLPSLIEGIAKRIKALGPSQGR